MSAIELRAEQELSLGELAAAIDDQHEQCVLAYRNALTHAEEAGKLLLRAKEQVQRELGRGHWLRWLRENTQIGERTAQVYMQVAEDLPTLTASGHQPRSIKEALTLLNPEPEVIEPELVIEPEPEPAKPRPAKLEVGDRAIVTAAGHLHQGKEVEIVERRGTGTLVVYVARVGNEEFPFMPVEIHPAAPQQQPERTKAISQKQARNLLERCYQEAAAVFSVELRSELEAALGIA